MSKRQNESEDEEKNKKQKLLSEDERIKILEEDLDNIDFIIELGKIYYHKKQKFYEKSFEIFKKGAELKHPLCLNMLGKHYLYGYGTKKDLNKAKELFEMCVGSSDKKHFKNLGKYYLELKNLNMAMKMFTFGEELNEPSAINNIGIMHENGECIEQNFQTAKEYYERSYKLGCKDAVYNLGRCYHHGIGVEKDFKKASEYYIEGVQRKSRGSMNNLGVLYYEGKSFTQDYEKAKEYYQMAIELGDGKAMYNYALLYKHGKGVEKNPIKEREYYEKAIEHGNILAINNLGLLYKQGNGVKINYQKAKEYFELGMEKGNYNAVHNLAVLYEDGLGVTKDLDMAKFLYEKAINEGDNVLSMCNLGDLYFSGEFENITNSRSFAKQYYEMAISFGSKDEGVFGNLGIILIDNTDTFEMGKKYLEFARNNGYKEPQVLYASGVVEFKEKNYSKAREFFLESKNCTESKNALQYMDDNKILFFE